MKYLKQYEKLNNFKISEKDMEWILSSPDGFNSREEAEEYIDDLLSWNYKNLQDEIYLYRILFTDKVNVDDLGKHWTLDKDNVIDPDWIDRIRETTSAEDIEPLIIRAKFKFTDIDQVATLKTNVLYPNEEEITIHKNSKPIEFNIYTKKQFKEL